MAKISFTKLGLTKNTEVKIVEFNGQNIEVKQYLPIKDKINLVETIVNNCITDDVYWNPIRIDLWTRIEIFCAYTNINVTDKQREDGHKFYDLIQCLYKEIINNIPEEEIKFINDTVHETMESVYKYRNSALGLLDNINANYENLKFETEDIEKTLQNPSNFSLVREVLDKMG